jgi:hypothetical protein
MKKLIATVFLLGLCLLTAPRVHAQATGNAASVINSFIATFAKDNPMWKTDIVAITDPSNVAPGRQLGYSAVLGYYTFLPKTWEQLTEEERKDVYNDPRLKPFIISLRNYNNYPSITSTDTPKPAFGVYPVEGFAPRPAYPAPSPYYSYPSGYYYTPGQVQMMNQPAMQQPMMYPQQQMQMQQPMPMGYYPLQTAVQPNMMSAPAGYYYAPQQLSNGPALVQPITVTQPKQPQISQLKMTPEEMLLDRPLKIYMQNK